ncbi:hypothetical protein [Amycolatopsis sp. H20-H5]|uniref:hypothetical protein n=1 Tax=Amycolatopsis sp. H20-H5 TaxID=3046309 RepID=UPI002DB5CDC2|nr:hypothetical protein [Amycolatopsis sp. H20-H5]MEC3979704.1 hypothetical protein [Amycolatopsis sp. H20-H5]
MTQSHPHHAAAAKTKDRWLNPALAAGFALVVAGGAKGAFALSTGMMTNIAFIGAWLMLCLGLAYAAVRLRPKVGGALLVGFGIGAVLVVIFGGMAIMS